VDPVTRDRFEAERRALLAQLRDWLARGADLAEVEDEIKATAAAMRQLAHLAMLAREARQKERVG
jgi:hypothetical protein